MCAPSRRRRGRVSPRGAIGRECGTGTSQCSTPYSSLSSRERGPKIAQERLESFDLGAKDGPAFRADAKRATAVVIPAGNFGDPVVRAHSAQTSIEIRGI